MFRFCFITVNNIFYFCFLSSHQVVTCRAIVPYIPQDVQQENEDTFVEEEEEILPTEDETAENSFTGGGCHNVQFTEEPNE